MKIEIEISEKNECTSAPYWLIIDPRQNLAVSDDGVENIGFRVTGPFFSRDEANKVLKSHQYRYSKNARIYCNSTHHRGSVNSHYMRKVDF